MKIAAIYQGDGSTIDNLTVITDDRDVMRGTVAYLGCSESGLGYSQWGELKESDVCRLSADRTRLVYDLRNHLGKRVKFEDLSAVTQKHLAERILL